MGKKSVKKNIAPSKNNTMNESLDKALVKVNNMVLQEKRVGARLNIRTKGHQQAQGLSKGVYCEEHIARQNPTRRNTKRYRSLKLIKEKVKREKKKKSAAID